MGALLQGKVALVTGAARGIGRATAVAFAREGADVLGFDVAGPPARIESGVTAATSADLAETGESVAAEGQRWIGVTGDVRDLAALRAAAGRARSELGTLDIVFADAGLQAFKPLLEMEDADWHEQIDINLTGTANTIRATAPLLVANGGGRIIVTSSTQGRHGTKYGASYSASKWGILGLMKSAALELGEYKITVNAVVPGLIDTALTEHEERFAQALAESGQRPTGDLEKDRAAALHGLAGKSPLGVALIPPEAVAPVVVFLASEQAAMVTGAAYEVTAGDSAHLP